MTDETKNGGPAFPCEVMPGGPDDNFHQNGISTAFQYGMTLRDYFAAKALPAVCADYFESAQKVGFDEGWMAGVAMDAYAMADAMLKAREVTK